MKRILVTGSNGLLGQKLTLLAVQTKRWELIATSRGANRYPQEEGYCYAPVDVSDYAALSRALDEYRPDVIINTAAVTNVDTCEQQPELCVQLNVLAVKNMAAECKRRGIHLIHLSTDFVFDGLKGPYAEDDPVSPLNLYGRSKVASEEALRVSGCRWTVIRTILVYGISNDMSRSNIVLWAREALQKGQLINVVNDQWRMPTLAEDLAEACLLAAEKGAEGVYHISGSELMSIYQLVCTVADHYGLDKSLINPVPYASLNQAARRPLKTGFVLIKAREQLGYEPSGFEYGLHLMDRQLKARTPNI